ncbi:hypothetical protein [Amycolatopsis sp. NPDC001319]|uniref:hypothetical protein n=1 Tax=unclassified Amycolatopsis TaxID=2618356 RepID=UPI003699BB17
MVGYVNRAVPDAELDEYVDALARRIASFGRQPIAAAKTLVNRTTLPDVRHLVESQAKFGESADVSLRLGCEVIFCPLWHYCKMPPRS